jgi:hypothetical protein
MRLHAYRVIAGTLIAACAALSTAWAAPEYREEFVFPFNARHNHAPGIVECPNGDLIASWYRGSGERRADDVAILGARLRKGESTWSEPFVMADYDGFPDCNTCMMLDKHKKLWVFWPIIVSRPTTARTARPSGSGRASSSSSRAARPRSSRPRR